MAWIGFNIATLLKSVKPSNIILVGINNIKVIEIPKVPDIKPIIKVSALKTLVISFF